MFTCLHVGRVAPQRGWAMAAHSHQQFWELIVVLAGELETKIAGQTLLGREGEVLLYPRGMEHVERARGSQSLETIFITWVPRREKAVQDWPLTRSDPMGRMRMLATWMHEAGPLRHGDGIHDHLLAALLHAYSIGRNRGKTR